MVLNATLRTLWLAWAQSRAVKRLFIAAHASNIALIPVPRAKTAKTVPLGPLSNAKRPLYQDKLGANIGEVEKQGVCAGIEGSADDAARFCDFVHEAAAHGIEIELFNNGETLASSRSAWDLIDLAFARNCSGSAGAGTAASVRQAE
jgi:hypothetical protein